MGLFFSRGRAFIQPEQQNIHVIPLFQYKMSVKRMYSQEQRASFPFAQLNELELLIGPLEGRITTHAYLVQHAHFAVSARLRSVAVP